MKKVITILVIFCSLFVTSCTKQELKKIPDNINANNVSEDLNEPQKVKKITFNEETKFFSPTVNNFITTNGKVIVYQPVESGSFVTIKKTNGEEVTKINNLSGKSFIIYNDWIYFVNVFADAAALLRTNLTTLKTEEVLKNEYSNIQVFDIKKVDNKLYCIGDTFVNDENGPDLDKKVNMTNVLEVDLSNLKTSIIYSFKNKNNEKGLEFYNGYIKVNMGKNVVGFIDYYGKNINNSITNEANEFVEINGYIYYSKLENNELWHMKKDGSEKLIVSKNYAHNLFYINENLYFLESAKEGSSEVDKLFSYNVFDKTQPKVVANDVYGLAVPLYDKIFYVGKDFVEVINLDGSGKSYLE